MKRQRNIFWHFSLVLLIATLGNAQFNLQNQPIVFRNDEQPNVEPLNNIPGPGEVTDVINKEPAFDDLLPQGNDLLPSVTEPNVTPPKVEANLPNVDANPVYPVFVPENNDAPINEVPTNLVPSQGDNLEENLNNENVEPPKNDELPENDIPLINDVKPNDGLEEKPSLDDNLEDNINNGNVEPSIDEEPHDNNAPNINEETPLKPPVNDNLAPEITNKPNINGELDNGNVDPSLNDNLAPEITNQPSENEGPNNSNVKPPQNNNLSPEINIPSKDEEKPINPNQGPDTVVPPNVENPTNNDSSNILTTGKDEVPSPNEENKPNPGIAPESNEIAPPPPHPPVVPPNDNGHGHGNGNNDHGHGNHHRYRCRKRFGYFKIDGFCDKYVECKNYRPRQKICPDGMYFNEKALWSEYPCGYPSDVPCRSRNAPPPSHTSYYCPHQYGFFPFESQDIRDQCSQYIMCSGGAPNVMKCPESLVFNVRVGRCDWPEQVPGCEGLTEFKCPDEFEAEDYNENDLDVSVVRNYKHEVKCSYFWSCLRGQARMLRCDYGMIFDSSTGRCVVDEFGSCNEYYYPDPPKEDNVDE